MENYAKFLSMLLNSITVTHVHHLQTQSYAEHKALGSYYADVEDLIDTLIESMQGKYGLIYGYEYSSDDIDMNPLEYMIKLHEYVLGYRVTMPQDSHIQNIIDEIVALIDSTIYKLRFLK